MEPTSPAQPHPVAYNPDNLLNALIERLELKKDAALARLLEIAPPLLSKIRHRRLPVGAALLIRMHEVSGLPVRELRNLMGDRRQKYRISLVQGKPKEGL
jgi:plasmid maintenance system antidote protein VapI